VVAAPRAQEGLEQGVKTMTKFRLGGAVAGATCFIALGTANVLAAEAAAPRVTYLTAERMVDVVKGGYSANPALVIEGERIAKIGTKSTLAPPAGATVIDLKGMTILPGLIDMHVHLTGDADVHGYRRLEKSVPDQTLSGVRNAQTTLMAGFTTVRNVGAGAFADVALRNAINAGKISGPRMAAAGEPLGATGGHCDENLLPAEYNRVSPAVADGPWALVSKVRREAKYGADLIKVCATGGVLSKGDSVGGQQLAPEEFTAIVTEAHRLDMKVAAHAHGAEGIKAALIAGVDTIEHASLIDDEGIKIAKAKGAYLSMDIYNDDYILGEGEKAGILPESLEKERMIGKAQRENFQRAHKAGVKMVFGTDGGVYPHGDNAKQFAYMVQYGMTPIQAIQAATINAADALGHAKGASMTDVGSLEIGRFGDVIAIKGDVLTDIRLLEQVPVVIKGGQLVKGGPSP
jgi:imidazolonepropionase-like amidohydrolase